jgi:hypothetical protein
VKASDITSDAAALLIDADHAYWTQDELLSYLGEAQRALVNVCPQANAVTATVTLDEGAAQTLPDDAIRLLGNVHIDAGAALTEISPSVLDRAAPAWRSEDKTDTPQHYMYDPRYPLAFAVYPPAEADTDIELTYAAVPDEITKAGDTLTVADFYRPALLDYVLFRALSKDTEAGNANAAQLHYQLFMKALGVESKTERAVTAGVPDPANPRELQ